MPQQPNTQHAHDIYGMRLALQQAKRAANMQEVPVGAVVIAADNSTILGQAHNRTIGNNDPSAHAEILALRQAAQALQNYRLDGCTVYITLEPCAMCAAAMLHARVARVVYAVADTKTGAAGSVLNIFAQPQLNHHTTIAQFNTHKNSIEAQEIQCACTEQLQQFFSQRRHAQRIQRQQPKHAALRDDALRPQPLRFANIPQITALQAHSQWYLAPDGNKPAWRMHYWDTDTKNTSKPTAILLHGYSSYGLLWANAIAQLKQLGWRVLAPDILGFGQSDKPKKLTQHSLKWHARILQTWLQTVDIENAKNIILVGCDNTSLLLPSLIQQLATHSNQPIKPQAIALIPEQSKIAPREHWRTHCQQKNLFDLDAHWALDTTEQQLQAWSAPFADVGHRAALRSDFWADATAASLSSTNQQIEYISTLDSGSALRQWLDAHILALLQSKYS